MVLYHPQIVVLSLSFQLPGSSIVGLPNRPCQAGARFRRFTFVRNDYWYGTRNSIRFNSSTFPIVVRMNGIPRTVMGNISILNSNYANYTFNTSRDYTLCNNPEERVGGNMYVYLEDGTCQPIPNPVINFTGFETLPTYVLSITVGTGLLRSIDLPFSDGGEFLATLPLNDTRCSSIPDVVDVNEPPVIVALSDGSWLQFDARLKLEDNTIENPIPDGGGLNMIHSGKVMSCSNVPRTYLNENQCSASYVPLTCGTVSSTPDTYMKSDEPTLLTLFKWTGRYVYGLKGLPVIDEYNSMIPHPGTPGLRSRWLI